MDHFVHVPNRLGGVAIDQEGSQIVHFDPQVPLQRKELDEHLQFLALL